MDADDLFAKTGEFGPYQIRQYLLLSFPILFSSYQTVSYIFTTGKPTFRCTVPECESGRSDIDYDEPWVSRSIPLDDRGIADRCSRYEPIYSPNSFPGGSNRNSCYPYEFNRESRVRCDSWIFKDNENTIVNEFNFICSGDSWKIALVGTMNYLGFFIGMPVSGIFADRYGRKKILVISCVVQSVFGALRSFSPNYGIFLGLQFLGAFMCGAYNAGFVLGLEIVGPSKRVLGNAIICCFHSIGETVVGLLMWLLKDWRLLTRFLFVPGLLFILYLWMIPESIRWLIAKGRIDETLTIFNRMAKVNKKSLSTDLNIFQLTVNKLPENDKIFTVEKFKEVPSSDELRMKSKYKTKACASSSLIKVVKSSKLMIRAAICTVCWIVITMIFYGSSLFSVSVDIGNKYFNFILTILVELPGYLSTWFLMDIVKVGRRPSLALSFLMTSLTCFSFYYITGIPWVRLVLFLMGKFSITFAYAVIYIYTAEMFPTEVRSSLLGLCSMAGHFGSMLAPQCMLLSKFIEPPLLWGIIALIAGAISTYLPETLNTKLPDTIEDAEKIGQTRLPR